MQRLIETESFKPLSLSATGLEMLMVSGCFWSSDDWKWRYVPFFSHCNGDNDDKPR